jgi:hypothetical protein
MVPLENIHNYDLERLYTILYDPNDGLIPGRNPIGEQILVGPLDVNLLVAIFFSSAGKYNRYQFYPVIRVPDPNSPETITSQESSILSEASQEFVEKLKMTPCDVQIHHFAFPEWDIGIAEWLLCDYPDYQRSVATGVPLSDKRLIDWQRERRWVLHWTDEFEMSNEGEVVAS